MSKSLTDVVQDLRSLPGNHWGDTGDLASEMQTIRGGWQPISTAPAQRIVLVHYLNSHGKSRIIKARYVPMLTEELDPDSEIDGDYCDIGDVFCVPAGWYEQIDNWYDFSELLVTEGQPDAWMPMPAPPGQKQEQQQ